MVKTHFIKKYHVLKKTQDFIKILTLLKSPFWRNVEVGVGLVPVIRQTGSWLAEAD